MKKFRYYCTLKQAMIDYIQNWKQLQKHLTCFLSTFFRLFTFLFLRADKVSLSGLSLQYRLQYSILKINFFYSCIIFFELQGCIIILIQGNLYHNEGHWTKYCNTVHFNLFDCLWIYSLLFQSSDSIITYCTVLYLISYFLSSFCIIPCL